MTFSYDLRNRVRSTRGMTLVEMLVALTVTLIMMGAVITVFGFIGEQVTDSRSIIETNDRLRSAAHRLREDLGSVTAEMMPPLRPESGSGYFEIIEGPERSYPTQPGGSFDSANRLKVSGDFDDALFCTIRSAGEPFRGKFGNTSYESPTAEVAWYLRESPGQSPAANPKTYVLCRKLMLISAELSGIPFDSTFYENYDISARLGPGGTAVANTLGDLTKRENRFARLNTFPHAVDLTSTSPIQLFNSRVGEDVVLTNVLGMDVQVWDPAAPLKKLDAHDTILTPNDPPYREASAKKYPNVTDPKLGAYVDLGLLRAQSPYSTAPGTLFMGTPHQKSGLALGFTYATYDTWSYHYEHDGERQPTATIMPNTIIDAGTNGIDDNAAAYAGIDDVSERETMPPYPLPLRGVRVTLRVYEPSSRQVREVTVVESFVPE